MRKLKKTKYFSHINNKTLFFMCETYSTKKVKEIAILYLYSNNKTHTKVAIGRVQEHHDHEVCQKISTLPLEIKFLITISTFRYTNH